MVVNWSGEKVRLSYASKGTTRTSLAASGAVHAVEPAGRTGGWQHENVVDARIETSTGQFDELFGVINRKIFSESQL